MMQRVFQWIFTIVGAIVGYYAFEGLKALFHMFGLKLFEGMTAAQSSMFSFVFAIIFALLFFMLAPFLNKVGRRVGSEGGEIDLQQMDPGEIGLSVGGAIIGILVAFLLSQLYSLISIPAISVILTVVSYLVLGYLGSVIGRSQGKRIKLPSLNLQRRGQDRGKVKTGVPKILDTSVIIDGRILDILETGFLEGQIVIPEFVLLELQHISDSSDGLKRNRGRRGLDVLNQIREKYGVEIYDTNGDKSLEEIPEVDVKLLKLAQRMDGKVLTNDFNLNKVAGVKGVDVLNINDLANAVKPVVLPGERMRISLVKEGKNQDQALGYLDDGTMIVVEEGKPFIGENIEVVVSSVLQTSAGRMIFARPS